MAEAVSDKLFDPKAKSTLKASPGLKAVSKSASNDQARIAEWEEGVNDLFGTAAGALITVGAIAGNDSMLADAQVFTTHGPKVAHEIAAFGAKNPYVGKVLDYVKVASGAGGLLVALVPMIGQLLVNHDKAPPIPQMGMVPKEMLAAQVKAELAEATAEAIKAQQEAEQKLADLQAQQEAKEE